MYSKLYKTIFDGSLYGQFEGLTVFMAMLALADQHGEVDCAPAKIAGCLGASLEFVMKGIHLLESPDPGSRTPAEEGKRIIPMLNDEGQPRPFGWKIVNYMKYRSIRSEDERRVYKREWDRTHRGKNRNPTNPTETDRIRPLATQPEAEAEAERTTLLGKPNDFQLGEKKNSLRDQAIEVLKFLNEKTGRAYRPVDANLGPIVARIKSGASMQDCKTMIVRKWRDWHKDEKMEKYLRPKTLFSASNFENYLGECV